MMKFNTPVILRDSFTRTWLRFENPARVICARSLAEVLPCLREVETCVDKNGWHAAGFISYEAAPAFDSALTVRDAGGFPLLWFGLYPSVQHSQALEQDSAGWQVDTWQPTVSRESYNAAIQHVKDQIAHGRTYQVNYTFRLRNQFSGSPWALFVDMVNAQAPGYSAYLDTGEHVICSASPELFFKMDGETVTCRPMKGTTPRGLTLEQDEEQAAWLRASSKNRAENVMIVDMVRNDLGRLARTGSVRVPELFVTERYPTLWQMTSGVTAEIPSSFSEIMTALFPCASITGAPKVSTMQIIAALETTPRRIYTGAIGYLSPGRRAQFSVAIRSLLLEKATGSAEYGIGGGIVWDSTSRDEYAEALLKARVLTKRNPVFSLLETLGWTPGQGFTLLEEHLERMRSSAIYFDFPFAPSQAISALEKAAEKGELAPQPLRVRLLLGRTGDLQVETYPFQRLENPPKVSLKLARAPIDPGNLFLYHKTTHRMFYEEARKGVTGCDDVILYNENAEITETSIANLVFELNGELVTPPVHCGLLPGTLRAHLLAEGKIREQVVLLSDLPNCTRIWLINSLRGWREAQLLPG
jgi:para-aminobenzoate synthetase/4-amino-4-deoxychorismate lyase